ncbi:BrnA antitoxin family protein [Phenylobacterium sp.]|uniref:BrnA antitoxin family protein n=1 Tax=Phenylobacterium sp. TaxID=1871053 RepID=UPI0025F276FF|nr:BrnA antitoxin family protein [Phenylobacterium sp.]MBX3483160.1 BrnA antitoxin family protein [Phenylobacterium sp.]
MFSIDERFDYGEVREIAIGFIAERLFVLVYVETDTGSAPSASGRQNPMSDTAMPKKPSPPEGFDDNPPLTEAFWAKARPAREKGAAFMEKVTRKPGRPAEGEAPKSAISLRLDTAVLERLRAGGRGWQSRLAAKVKQLVDAGEL